MAALLLLALKATAYHGEDNNWLVRVDGMIDANKCLRVGSITDLGADEANSNTGDRTTPNSNVTCGFGSAGLAPMCSLSKEAGSGVVGARVAVGVGGAQAPCLRYRLLVEVFELPYKALPGNLSLKYPLHAKHRR